MVDTQAGLFSAVLTGCVLESYTLLQPDRDQQTVDLLKFIAIQLSDPRAQTLDILTLTTAPTRSPSAPRINILWFTALVCSLVVALLGILAKQWLREYLFLPPTSAREAIRLRQFRHEGLVFWRVEEMMATLPVLLEISLVLFLIGLLDFLWMLDWSVAAVITLLVGISLAIYFGTTILPLFSARNPFKSPQAWASYRLLRRFLPASVVRTQTIAAMSPQDYFEDYLHGSWIQREIAFVRENGEGLDYRALVWACQQATDNSFLTLVALCVSELEAAEVAWLILEIIAHRGECNAVTLLGSLRTTAPSLYVEKFLRKVKQGRVSLVHMIVELLPRMDRYITDESQVMVADILCILRRLLRAGESAACDLPEHRAALDSVTSVLDGEAPRHIQNAALGVLSDMTQLGCNIDYCPKGLV